MCLALLLYTQSSWGQEPKPPKRLFVDDHLVEPSDGVTRVWQAARKANEGKPIRFWQRDEKGNRVPLKAAIYASAIYDEQRGVFQMWSRVFPGLKPGTALEGTEAHKHMRYGYCESRDGIDFDLDCELKGLHSNGDYAWDKDMVFPSSWIITRGQEHWIYYGGANERHWVAEIFQPKRFMAMGLAKRPLDGTFNSHSNTNPKRDRVRAVDSF